MPKIFQRKLMIIFCFVFIILCFFRKISKAKQLLEDSTIILNLIEKVSSHFKTFDQLICYGLGSFSDSTSSLHQLACLLLLKDYFKVKTSVYDPVFTPCDKVSLASHGIDVLEHNDEGKTRIPASGNTLIFFPHVPNQLVNNFLWANWNPALRNCVIISNTFSVVVDRYFSKPDHLSFMRRILSYCEEKPIENTYPIEFAFNDLAVHSFLAIENTEPNFWQTYSEPFYEDSAVEYFVKDLVILMKKL